MSNRTLIRAVRGLRVWDSRGRPTIEAEVLLEGGGRGRAIAPAGASTGSAEARDLRDGGAPFGGQDVTRALARLESLIAPALAGLDASDQALVDRCLIELDDTPMKARLGANAMVAVSMAVAQAAALAAGEPLWRYLRAEGAELPLPEIQIFGGGAHAARRVDVQDFMVVCPGAATFAECLDWTAEVYRAAGELMAEAGILQGVADEGGFWPAFETNEEALALLVRAIERAGRRPGEEVAISLDVAASEFGRQGRYSLGLEGQERDSDGLIAVLDGWLARYPIRLIEDPLGEDDPDGFARFSEVAAGRCRVVADDLTVTEAGRVQAMAARGAADTLLIKPNQRGTLTEAREAWDAARAAGWSGIVSARSGESEDTTIVHLAVGWGVPMLKVGSFARSERMAKWNEGLRIARELGADARLARPFAEPR